MSESGPIAREGTPGAARAPIAFFAFNRSLHAGQALEALARCAGAAESELFIFLDGPRNEAEARECSAVASIARGTTGFKAVTISASAVNKGLYNSITEGVSDVLARSERVIVVEDDLVVEGAFLDYMDYFLDCYASNPRVGSIHGYALPVRGLPAYYFLRGADCWGWATWRDRWSLFRNDAQGVLAELDAGGRTALFMRTHGASSLSLLCDRVEGINQSWAILWHASLFLADRLTLHPGESLVRNIGVDGSGTNSTPSERFRPAPRQSTRAQFEVIPVITDDEAARLTSAFMDGVEGNAFAAILIWLRRSRATRRARRLLQRTGRPDTRPTSSSP